MPERLTPEHEARIREDDKRYLVPLNLAFDRRLLLAEIDALRGELEREQEAGNFFSGRTLDELARIQNISGATDPSKLVGGFPEDEDIDVFLKDIYESRNKHH